MKVSFLVTYYNQQNFVNQSLDSILRVQKKCDWEILIGDDGSSDNTVDIVKKYIEKYPDNIKLYVMERDKNKKYDSVKRASENRLNLLEHCSGNFFCVLDGDDFYCDETFVNEAINEFTKDKRLSIVAFNYQLFYSKDHIDIPKGMHKTFSNISFVKYLKKFYVHAGACVFLHGSCRDDVERIKQIGYYDDNDIIVNNLNYGNMFYIDRVIYSYRQTGSSVWTSMNKIEQNLLNCLGYDVEVLISPKLKKYLDFRYFYPLYYTWKDKENLDNIIGKEKTEKYISLSKEIKNSKLYEILNFDEQTDYNKNELKKFFLKMFFIHPEFFLSKIKHSLLSFFK